jgi:hypothetical protein
VGNSNGECNQKSRTGIPVQIGVHQESLSTANNMRIDDIASVADEDLMHAYPLYTDVARSFLDPELVPFSCALTAELAGTGRAPLMQEFGLCTAPQGAVGRTITDDFLGAPRSQYLASEHEGAAYYEAVLNGLVKMGAAGAYAWSYGDYDARLFDRAPLSTAIRERTFGLVRADGSENLRRRVSPIQNTPRRRDTCLSKPEHSAPARCDCRRVLRESVCQFRTTVRELAFTGRCMIAPLERFAANPVVSPSHIPFTHASGSFNPGATIDPRERTCHPARSRLRERHSSLMPCPRSFI